MDPHIQDYREVLKKELNERASVQPNYSLRVFAKDLGVSPNHLSQVINRHKGLSATQAKKISASLGLRPLEANLFSLLVQSEHARYPALRNAAKIEILSLMKEISNRELNEDQFKLVSDWRNFAVLEFLKIKSNYSVQKELAKRFMTSETEIQMILSRLERLGLILKTPRGYQHNQNTVIAEKHRNPEAMAKFHESVLDKARTTVRTQSSEERTLRSHFFPIRNKDISAAQNDLAKFYELFLKTYSYSHETAPDEIYCLSTQFFRVTESGKP